MKKSLISEGLIDLVLRAGKLALETRQKNKLTIDEYKDGHDNWRTNAEVSITKLLQGNLDGLLPCWQLKSEDNNCSYIGQGKELVVDEIDGTNNYTNGLDNWAISLGLIDNGQPVAGIVYLPDRDLVIWGESGCGVWGLKPKNQSSLGLFLELAGVDSLAKARGTFDFTYQHDARELQWTKNAAGELLYKVKSLSKFICQVVGVLEIVFGRADFFFHLKTKPWDMAAVVAIATQVGVKVYDLNGQPYCLGQEQILIANGQVPVDEILSIIRAVEPK